MLEQLEAEEGATDASGRLVPLSTIARAEIKRLRKNVAIADALRRLALAAPDVDGSARRGQYVLYTHGGLDSPLWGRHYACGTYIDSGGKRRSPDLQGCPREVRLLLAGPFCHDLDFKNSLPTVASQLDALGLCPAHLLTLLKDYVANRGAWFADIIAHHNIPPQPAAGETAEGIAKQLPIRILHGGSYASWVAEFALLGVRDTGVAGGYGCPRVHAFEAQVKVARAATVREMRCRHP